ncbi:hypothetical protein [Desulfitobacterium sp.]|uniref:hypothetical protein n=1 Tax=Desulfitobacterium sp. TaxID=49981 RepID=UPI002C41ECEB|nr:hypothetical protein [Desulfitobacterium sp.]HVJ47849.1 hypothetical protein [Desulfitobacterium sp.]
MPANEDKLLRWSSIIATVGTAILALTALITVYVTLNAWKVQREDARPYLSLKESPQIEVQEGVQLEFRFNNVGIHPAVNLSSQSIIFEQSLKQKPIYNERYDLVNEIPKDTSSSLVIALTPEEVGQSSNVSNSYYLVVLLQYSDPVINKQYQQSLLLKWNGIKEGKALAIVHVQAQEKEKITLYLQANQVSLN